MNKAVRNQRDHREEVLEEAELVIFLPGEKKWPGQSRKAG